MRNVLGWAGWLLLLTIIIGGTVTLFRYWAPRQNNPPPIVARPPPPTPAAKDAPERAVLQQRLERIREERARLQALRDKHETRCYSGELLAKINGAWTNIGRC